MIDWNKPIEVRYGGQTHPARLICSDRDDKVNNFTHIVLYYNGVCENVVNVTEQGCSYGLQIVFNVPPPKIKGKLYLYYDVPGGVFFTMSQRRTCKNDLKFIKELEVEYEEGC